MTRHDGLFSIAADILEELIHIGLSAIINEQLVGRHDSRMSRRAFRARCPY